MDVSQLPFNRLIGLETAERESGYLLGLPDGPQYTNHLGTVHASALMAVAEASAGAFLSQEFPNENGLIPVVRRFEAKFRKPASGRVFARCMVRPDEVEHWRNELAYRKRMSATIPVEVVDASGTAVLFAMVEWIITRS